ncbi:MAG: hypothetical protein ACREM3_10140 [Candidatus Rokuibacteriota bacterium]
MKALGGGHRLLRLRVSIAASLATLVGLIALSVGSARPSGAWFLAVALGGLALFGVGALRVVHRLATARPPAALRPLAPHAETLILLAALDLALLSPLAPLFQGMASGLATQPSHNPVARQAFEMAGGLTGQVLVGVFTAGVVMVAWLVLVRLLGPLLKPLAGARRLGRAMDAVLVAAMVVFCVVGAVLWYNASLDRSPSTSRHADLVSVSGIPMPFGAGVLGWAEVRYLDAPGRVERLILTPRDDVWPERAAPGLPLRVEMRRGFLGIPWVHTVTIDRERDLRRALAEVPAAAAFRKSLIDMLVTRSRWDDVHGETQALLRSYPGDRQFALFVVQKLRAAGQHGRALDLERLAGPR